MLRGEAQVDRAGDSGVSPCGQGSVRSLWTGQGQPRGGSQGHCEAAEQAGGWGRSVEGQPGIPSWRRVTMEGRGRGMTTKERRCREPGGRQSLGRGGSRKRGTEEPRGALPPRGACRRGEPAAAGTEGKEPPGAGWLAGLCCRLLAAVPPAAPAHLLLRVLEGDHQHHVPSLELQLIRVGGRVVVLGLHLQRVGERWHPFPRRPLSPLPSPGRRSK